jgi:hypothetical protein
MRITRQREGILMTILFLLALIAFDLLFMGRPMPETVPITGQVVATVNVSGFVFGDCTYELPANNSLFSAYCLANENNITEAFSNLTSLQYVFAFEPADASNPWRSYNPRLPAWAVQDLRVVSRNKGYWIRMARPENFTHSGIIKFENSIPVEQGWNLIGYPLFIVQETSVTFASINGQYEEVAGFNETLQEYQTYQPGLSNNTLNWTTPYHGYWVKATQDSTVTMFNPIP